MLRNRSGYKGSQSQKANDRDHDHVSYLPTTNRNSVKLVRKESKYLLACLFLISFSIVMFVQRNLSREKSSVTFLNTPSNEKANEITNNVEKLSDNQSWPGHAIEDVGYPLVRKGTNFVNDMREILFTPDSKGKTLMDEFIQIYKNRPDKVNMCGIRFNHALALFVAVKQLKPRLVIESGVNAGQSTYFLRHAKKDMEIIAIDPLDEPICGTKKRWIDDSGQTKYYTGDKFVDIAEFDWIGMAKNSSITPSRTLVFLDDHQEVLQRFPSLMKAGIRHVIVEDNYKRGEGATQSDRDGQTPKQLFAFRRKKDNGTLNDANWLYANLVSYAEFPALIPPIMSKKYEGTRKEAGGFMFHDDKNTDIVPPILRSDVNSDDLEKYKQIATKLGYDPELKDEESYMQFMNYNQICYMDLLPMAWRLVDKW